MELFSSQVERAQRTLACDTLYIVQVYRVTPIYVPTEMCVPGTYNVLQAIMRMTYPITFRHIKNVCVKCEK